MARFSVSELQRRRREEGAFTLIEVLVALLVLGIIMVPLTAAFIESIKRSNEVEATIGANADAQRIASWWTKDVHNVEANGYIPANSGLQCLKSGTLGGTEFPLVTFIWNTQTSSIPDPEDPGDVALAKTATWYVDGTGPNAQLVRRYCRGGEFEREDFVAGNIWKSGLDATKVVHGPERGDGQPGGYGVQNFCTTEDCTIVVSGNFNYELTVDRRVPGLDPPDPLTTPCPTLTGVLPGNGSLTASWLPSNVADGLPPVDQYRIILTTQINGAPAASATTNGATTSVTISGLTNGTGYYVQTQAHNAYGWGLLCDPAGPYTPAPVAPGAPEDVAALRPTGAGDEGGEKLTVTWDAPTDDGGAAVTEWKLRARIAATQELVGELSLAGPSVRSATMTGLPNGADVTATVSAINSSGEGPESQQSNEVRVCGVPLAPPQPTVNAELDQKTRIVFQEPDNRGCDIRRFRVYAFQNGSPAPYGPWYTDLAPEGESPTLEFTTPSLDAVEYQFAVAAVNDWTVDGSDLPIGEGALSVLSDPVDIDAVPLVAPGQVAWEPRWRPPVVSGGDDNIGGLLSWIPLPDEPAFNGGFSIIGYRVTVDPVTSGSTLTYNVDGANSDDFDMGVAPQTEGTFPNESYKEYDISVAAENDNGAGPAATVRAIPGGRPFGSPTTTSSTGYFAGSTAGSSAIRVEWDQVADVLANNGGRPLLGYQVQWNKQGTSTWSTFDIGGTGNLGGNLGGFDPGAAYNVRVATYNASGASIPAFTTTVYAPSLLTAPAASGLTMSRPSGTVGNRLTLTFPAFTTNPGNPTPAYSAVCNASGETAVNFTGLTPGTNTLTNPGLTNGKAWSCTVTAVTTYYNGSTSSASQTTSNSATPYTTPGTPGPLTVTAQAGGKAKLDWTAPASNGGSAITGYRVSVSPAVSGYPATVGAGTLTYTTPNALTFGTTYTFSVVALNAAGASSASTASPYTPSSSVPTAAPTGLTATPVFSNQIRLDWTPVPNTSPQNGGSSLTSQRVTLSPAPTTGSATVTLPIGTTTYTYTTNQRSGSTVINYTATVNAVNVNGNGPNASVAAVAGGAPTQAVTGLSPEPYNPSGTIRLNWTPVPNTSPQNGGQSITGYNITWSSGGGPESAPYYVGGQQTGAALGGYTPGVAYTFRVYANNTGGTAAGDGPAAVLVAVIPGNPTPVGTPLLERPSQPNVFGTLYLTFDAWNVGTGPPMTDYKATCTSSNGGVTVTDFPVSAGVQNSITGLSVLKTYTCSLTGRNLFSLTGTYGTATVTGIGPANTR